VSPDCLKPGSKGLTNYRINFRFRLQEGHTWLLKNEKSCHVLKSWIFSLRAWLYFREVFKNSTVPNLFDQLRGNFLSMYFQLFGHKRYGLENSSEMYCFQNIYSSQFVMLGFDKVNLWNSCLPLL
jgi:hypothetical protein